MWLKRYDLISRKERVLKCKKTKIRGVILKLDEKKLKKKSLVKVKESHMLSKKQTHHVQKHKKDYYKKKKWLNISINIETFNKMRWKKLLIDLVMWYWKK